MRTMARRKKEIQRKKYIVNKMSRNKTNLTQKEKEKTKVQGSNKSEIRARKRDSR